MKKENKKTFEELFKELGGIEIICNNKDNPEIKKGLEEIKMAMENLWKYTELSKEERIKKALEERIKED